MALLEILRQETARVDEWSPYNESGRTISRKIKFSSQARFLDGVINGIFEVEVYIPS